MDEEERNFCKLTLLLSSVGLTKLRKFFISEWNSVGGFVPWTDCPQNGTDLLTKFTTPHGINKVKSGDTTTWDLSLLVNVLLYARPPFVSRSNKALVDALKCLNEIRNELCHFDGKVDLPEFQSLYRDTCNALLLIGASSDEIQEVEEDMQQPSSEVLSQIQLCASQDEGILHLISKVHSRLDMVLRELEMVERSHQQPQKTGNQLLHAAGYSSLQQGQEDIRNLNTPKSKSLDIELYCAKLKEAIREQTDFLPKGSCQSLKTDDIFTNLTVYQSKQPSHQEDQSARATLVQNAEIFVDGNPRSILVSGEPGIGKTLFTHKLLRDWSANSMSIPDVKFSYLVTSRQLAILQKKKITLRELLNCSSLMNEDSLIDETVMEEIIEHPEKLFLVFDDFHEYRDHNILHEEFESQFTNDVNSMMPASALVSKLIKRKVLRDCVILVTSRPYKARKLDEIPFDKYMEIKGFSETQALEYFEKYFRSKPDEVKKMAMEKLKGTAHYLSFGQVPWACFLACYVNELETTNGHTRDKSIPLTLTQYYSEIIQYIERNNREICNLDEEAALVAVEKTFSNFAQLSALLVEQNRFTFTMEDLNKLQFTESEIVLLNSSSLIVCYPVAIGSLFSQTALEYGFAHLTLQEFFAALHYVRMDTVLALEEETSEMVDIFCSGLLGSESMYSLNKKDEVMAGVLENICKKVAPSIRRSLVLVRCLFEYGQEKELTRKQLATNPDYKYWNEDGRITLDGVTGVDCSTIAMLLDESMLTSLSSPPHSLHIEQSLLTCDGLKNLLSALTKPACNITTLALSGQLDDSCAEYLSQYLSLSKITVLDLTFNRISDSGLQYMLDHCTSNITKLILDDNLITDAGLKYIIDHCPHNLSWLSLAGNKITDIGVNYVVDYCPFNITWLNLLHSQVSDSCREGMGLFVRNNYPDLNFMI